MVAIALVTLTGIVILQSFILRMIWKKLRETKAELDYAHSAEGQREITMNTIKNRMWY